METNNEKPISRRKFLKTALISTGGVLAACAGITGVSMVPPHIDFIETQCEEENKMKKVLIAYASKSGSTGEISEAIAQDLCDAGYSVDVKLVKDAKDLSGYDAVVVGSAIRMGNPLNEAVKFIKKNKKVLQKIPVAYFTVGIAMKEKTEEAEEKALSFMGKMTEQYDPKVMTAFAGVVDYQKLSPFFRKVLSAADDETMGEGDFRDWDAIHAWAAELPGLIG